MNLREKDNVLGKKCRSQSVLSSEVLLYRDGADMTRPLTRLRTRKRYSYKPFRHITGCTKVSLPYKTLKVCDIRKLSHPRPEYFVSSSSNDLPQIGNSGVAYAHARLLYMRYAIDLASLYSHRYYIYDIDKRVKSSRGYSRE